MWDLANMNTDKKVYLNRRKKSKLLTLFCSKYRNRDTNREAVETRLRADATKYTFFTLSCSKYRNRETNRGSVQTRLRGDAKISTFPLCNVAPKVLPHVCPQKDPHCSNMLLTTKQKVKSEQNYKPF